MDGGDNADMTVNNRSEEKNTQNKKRALLIITVIFVIVLVAVITAFYTLNKNHQNQNKNFTFANMEDCMQFYMNRNFGEQEASDKCHELEILDKGRDNMDVRHRKITVWEPGDLIHSLPLWSHREQKFTL